MDVYKATFGVLACAGTFLAYSHHKADFKLNRGSNKEDEAGASDISIETAASSFRRIFLIVYLLVMGSDWLQGPYIYTLYKDEKGLEESVVAALFTTGFVSAAISATFIGSLADFYGRRRFCLIFCLLYSISCLTVLSNDLITLFLGRVLGGVSTTLMYSIFESWMVTEYSARGLDRSSLSMSGMFGTMTTLNGLVAILAGVVGEAVVSYTGTKTSPFMTSIVCLFIAAYYIQSSWSENYGASAGNASEGTPAVSEKSGFQIIRQDKRIFVLGLISTCFEGTMYLFVFFWSAALKSSHALSAPSNTKGINLSHALSGGRPTPTPLPFGLIFATFMAAMMLGSLFFSLSASKTASTPPATTPTRRALQRLLTPSNLLTATIGVAATSLLIPIVTRGESVTFWCFCLFEAAIGVYFPSMANMKGRIVEDGVRAKVYGVLRVPLNVFVVGALSLTREGDEHRSRVFLFCGGLLLAASIAAGRFLPEDRPIGSGVPSTSRNGSAGSFDDEFTRLDSAEEGRKD